MDNEKKEFIEEATKSEYLDFILEREVEKKAKELTQRYKWIFSFFMFCLVVISSILGWQSSDISSKKADVDFMTHKITLESEIFEKDMEIKRKEFNYLFSNINENNTLILSELEDKYIKLTKKIENELEEFTNLSDSTRSFTSKTGNKLEELQTDIEKTNKEFNTKKKFWQDDINEMKKISSVVYAYVERGYDREFDELDPNEYKPTFINLPFSDKTLRITFNRKKIFKTIKIISGTEIIEKKKEAEVYITLFNEEMQEVKDTKKALVLFEREPQSILQNNYMIEAKFIYLPPNPLGIEIPDFVILEITLDPSKDEKLK